MRLYGLILECRNASSIAQLDRFIRLNQHAAAFKKVSRAVHLFNGAVSSMLLVGPAESLARSRPEPTRPGDAPFRLLSEPDSCFQTHSRMLFKSLSTHLEPCISRHHGSAHKARLRLGHVKHSKELGCKHELHLHLRLCPLDDRYRHPECFDGCQYGCPVDCGDDCPHGDIWHQTQCSAGQFIQYE